MRVVFTDYDQPDLILEQQLLSDAGLHYPVDEPQPQSEDEIIAQAKGAIALVVQKAKISERVLQALPTLRVISVPGIGVDSIDLAAARRHGVWVANVPDSNISEVACHAIAMALALTRHLPFFDADVRAGKWRYDSTGPLSRPSRMVLGLVGLGRIGRLTAAYASNLFGHVVGFDPVVQELEWPHGIKHCADVQSLCSGSDIVSLHLPLTTQSRGMVNAAFLAAMKPGSFLVNVSRGSIVDIPALIDALDSGHLGGAALDVLPDEPPRKDDPILRHPKVLLSPHAAFFSLESDEESRRRSITNIISLLKTGRPENVVLEGTR